MTALLLAAMLFVPGGVTSATKPAINCDAKKDGANILVHNCDADVTTLRPIKIRTSKKPKVKPIPK